METGFILYPLPVVVYFWTTMMSVLLGVHDLVVLFANFTSVDVVLPLIHLVNTLGHGSTAQVAFNDQ
jgi:hypothetical protein